MFIKPTSPVGGVVAKKIQWWLTEQPGWCPPGKSGHRKPAGSGCAHKAPGPEHSEVDFCGPSLQVIRDEWVSTEDREWGSPIPCLWCLLWHTCGPVIPGRPHGLAKVRAKHLGNGVLHWGSSYFWEGARSSLFHKKRDCSDFWRTLKKSFALRHFNCQEENFNKFFVLISRMKSIASCGVDFCRWSC